MALIGCMSHVIDFDSVPGSQNFQRWSGTLRPRVFRDDHVRYMKSLIWHHAAEGLLNFGFHDNHQRPDANWRPDQATTTAGDD